MKALVVELKLHWGFSIRRPRESAAQETLVYPPPSTLIGALARGYARIKGLSELVAERGSTYSAAVAVLDEVLYAAACVLGRVVRHHDISRNIAAVYLRPAHRPKREQWFAVQAVGKVYGPGTKLVAVYLVREEDRELLDAAYAIQALGSKEGIVSVLEARYAEARTLDTRRVQETPFYAPAEAVASCQGWVLEEFWDYRDPSAYEFPMRRLPALKPFYVPDQPNTSSLYDVVLSRSGVAVEVDGHVLVVERGVLR